MRETKYQPGMRFGRLVILERTEGRGNTRWLCQCDCGNQTKVYSPNLKSQRVQSCGCQRQERWESRRLERTMMNGYVFVKAPGHPRANPNSGRVREHILVMEKTLGRYLVPGEEVHHKNADRADNRPENLELWNRSQPAGARATDQVEWAMEILRMYKPESLTR